MAEHRTSSPGHRETLWLLVVGPTLWTLHFLACYITVAIWCEKASGPSLGPVNGLIGLYTLVALIGIGLTFGYGLRQYRVGGRHLSAPAGQRHRFLGFATALLCALSAVATLYVAMAALFFDSCLK